MHRACACGLRLSRNVGGCVCGRGRNYTRGAKRDALSQCEIDGLSSELQIFHNDMIEIKRRKQKCFRRFDYLN